MTVDYRQAGDLLEAYAQAFSRADGDAAVEIFARGCVVHLDPFAAPLEGHAGLRSYLLQLAGERRESELTIERHWVVGHTVLAAWHASHIQMPDNARVHLAGFLTMEVGPDGQVERMRQWWNRRQAVVT